jgi:hypothetical protein
LVRKDGAEARKERIEQIAKRILSKLYNGKEISLSREIAEIQYEFGLTKERIMEYLEILQTTDRFRLDKDRDKIRKLTEG